MKPRRVRFSGWLTLARPTVDELAAEFETALPNQSRPGERVVIVELEAPPVQRRTLRGLPAMNGSDLRALATHQASRIFRLPADGLVVDARWIRGRLGVRTGLGVAVDAGFVADLLTAAAQAGITIQDIIPASSPAESGMTLLPAEVLSGRHRSEWSRTLRAAAATAVFATALAGVTWRRHAVDADRISAELSQLREPALKVQAVRRQVDSLAAMVEAVQDARRAGARLGERVAAISASMPDSAVLTSLAVGRDTGLQVSGLAAEPFLVVGRLRRIKPFEQAKLDGNPVVEAAGGRTWSRFAIRVPSEPPP